ncbi:MAG TPA: Hpt domain-containing protein [Flavobacteriaceae bacterium]|nr:Hpt domain-containing protein [Flavobacteriaceae bacterium]
MNHYNLNMLEEMTGGDRDFMTEMAKAFVEEVAEDVRAMNEAIDYENAALTYQVAHKMKPNLQMFGLQLTSEIEQLEAWSKSILTKPEILPSAKKITDKVSKAISELQSDFDL